MAAPVRASWAACLTSLAGADRLVAAAVPGAQSWKSYVDGRTKLQSGVMDEPTSRAQRQQAAARGPGDVADFRRASADYVEVTATCAGLTPEKAPTEERSSVTACLARVMPANEAVTAAQTVVGAWSDQLGSLAALDSGAMTRANYDQAWDAAYHRSPGPIDRFLGPELDQYLPAADRQGSAVARLRDAPACGPAQRA